MSTTLTEELEQAASLIRRYCGPLSICDKLRARAARVREEEARLTALANEWSAGLMLLKAFNRITRPLPEAEPAK